MYVNFLSTYSDKKFCHTSTTLQTSIARFVSDSRASCDEIMVRRSDSDKAGSYFTEILLFQKSVLALSTELSYIGQILCNDEKSHTDYVYTTKIANFENGRRPPF